MFNKYLLFIFIISIPLLLWHCEKIQEPLYPASAFPMWKVDTLFAPDAM